MSDSFQISFRRDSRGGELRRMPLGSMDALLPRSRLVLLIHGYNVSEDQANQDFEVLANSLVQTAPALSGQIGVVHWPGDDTWKIGSLAAYPRRVQTAIDCANGLAKYIAAVQDAGGNPSEVVLIAHSLGARIVIETLLLLDKMGQRRIQVILMAAAYPVGLAELPVVTAAIGRATSLVLFSPADWVLRETFPPGESFSGVSGAGPFEAVGLYGRPYGAIWNKRLRMKDYVHGDYWRFPRAHAIICRTLGFSVPVPVLQVELAIRVAKKRSTPSWLAPTRTLLNR